MPQKLTLKENEAIYTIDVEQNDLTQPIILEQAGQEVAAIIPIERYRAFELWEQQQQPLSFYPTLMADKAAFERMEPSLLATHQGKYVAIRNGQMIDSGDNKMTLIKRVYEESGYGPMYVHKVGEPPRVAKLASPRVVRR